jgi:multiple sugar transport system substrate-binding protein
MNFLLNNLEANEILGTERGISGNSEVREMLRKGVPEEELRVFEYIELITETASPLPAPPPQGAGEVDALRTRTNEDISFGRRSIGEAVDGFFSEAERILGAG